MCWKVWSGRSSWQCGPRESPRQSLIDVTPGAARVAGFTGSMEQFEAAVVERYGFNRLDRARRRLLEALSEPLDDVLPPDQESTT